MRKEKVAVTGGSGMLGSDLAVIMPEHYYLSSKNYDLTSEISVETLFKELRPDGIVHLAATVGGIMDNIARPADYFDTNTLMNTLMVRAARKYNLKTFIGILSTCIYPDVCKKGYPMKEEWLNDGPPAKSNFSYGMAKRGLATQIESYNTQFGTKYQYLIPANLFGPNDKYDDGKSHFVAALIKKIHTALQSGDKSITLFGTGKPKRQFVYSPDVAEIIKICLEASIHVNMNIANEEYTIDEIANIALQACGADHLKIKYDSSKPDGQYQKTVSNELLKDTLPGYTFTSLYDGIKRTFQHYSKNNSHAI